MASSQASTAWRIASSSPELKLGAAIGGDFTSGLPETAGGASDVQAASVSRLARRLAAAMRFIDVSFARITYGLAARLSTRGGRSGMSKSERQITCERCGTAFS